MNAEPLPHGLTANQQVVMRFVQAWGHRDVEHLMSMFTPDAVYHNIPMEPVQGTAQIRAAIEQFVNMATQIEFVVHHIAESSAGTVLTERTDRFMMNGKWVDIPVMGTFELSGGRIAAWRDYFDMGQVNTRMAEATKAG